MGRIIRGARLVALNAVAAQYFLPKRVRRAIYRICDVRIGDSTVFSDCIVRSRSLQIGDGCFVNHGCFFGDGPIVIEDNVSLGVGVVLASSDHEVGPSGARAGGDRFGEIRVGRGTWIGARAVVLVGVRIGAGCVVGAGAVVTHDTEPDGVYVGVPARRLRNLS